GRREASGSPACRSARACSAARASSSQRPEAARVSTLSSQSGVASLPRPDPVPIRVLIVDDHPMVREGLRSMLEPAGVDVVGEAGTGEDALRIAAALRPEIVLLVLELPVLDGLAVLQRHTAVTHHMALL